MRPSLLPLIFFCAITSALASGAPTLADQAYGPAPEQRFDLHAPAGATAAPLILMVHGGGWTFGDKEMGRVVDHKTERWLPRGIAFVSINYRMQPVAPPLEQARDVARALAEVQKNAEKYGIDRNNIVLMGHSAGAHLIGLLAASPALAAEQGAAPWLGTILLDSGALDVTAIMNARHLPLYDHAFGSDPAFWRASSPFHLLKGTGAPLLAVCSSRRQDSCPQATNFVARATALGRQASVLPQDLSHGDINRLLGEDSAYTTAVEAFMAGLDPALAKRLDTRR